MYNIATPIAQGCAIAGLQDLALWQALVGMVNERITAVPAASISLIPLPLSGSDIQDKPAYYLALMQNALRSLVIYFANHTITSSIEGDTTHWFQGFLSGPPPSTGYTDCVWHFPDLRTAAGCASTTSDSSSIVNNMWIRFRPREIASATATADSQGNAAAADQVAFNAEDVGRVYVCASSGSWSREDTKTVDVLDNTQAAPNAVTNVDDKGIVQTGDYIRWEPLQEVRAVANLLREVWFGSVAVLTSTPPQYATLNSSTRSASATVLAPGSPGSVAGMLATNWAGATPVTATGTGLDFLPGILYRSVWQQPGAAWGYVGTEEWILSADTQQISASVGTASIGHSVRWCARPKANSADYNNNVGLQVDTALDDQGSTGLVDGAWHVFSSPGTTYNTTESYQFLDNTSLPPDVPAFISIADGAHNLNERWLGWFAKDLVVLVNYYPGFQYRF